MDINVTAIGRIIRYFGPPVSAVIISLVCLALTERSEATGSGSPLWARAFESLAEQVQPALAAFAIAATIWLGWRLWCWWRWEAGAQAGGCSRCFGPVSHKHGRYGAYSKCMICGSTQKGHR